MRTQTRPTDDPDCRPPAPWARLSLRQQQSFLSSLTTGKRKSFLESEADRILSDGRSARYQKNRDDRETHTDGRPLFDEFDGDKNNSDDDEPREIVLDGSHIPDSEVGDEAPGGAEISQDQEASLTSSWVDCSKEKELWGINEWNAVASLAPASLKNWDVLICLARGMSIADIAAAIGRTVRQTRNIIKQLWQYVEGLNVTDIVAHLDDKATTETVTRRPPSRAGRKPIAAAVVPRFLVLEPFVAEPEKPKRSYKPRVRRPRYVDPLQTDMFQEAA